MDDARPPITPETKVGELLQHYPVLEAVLLEISPSYQALKNPVLRRTVAKVATLRQVAKVGGVPLGTLVGRLRAAAGQPEEGLASEGEESAPPPAWADAATAWRTWDARPTIESGGHPMEQVMKDLAALPAGQVYALITPFVPAPLVDLAAKQGFEAYSTHEAPELVRTYFRRG
ncbi:MAG: DUF1858 domain-containing protein [Armatimonadetes bacterium]|nr:DUF1858 domain-containing protein [Armatimonadota bacterium]